MKINMAESELLPVGHVDMFTAWLVSWNIGVFVVNDIHQPAELILRQR